jgi:hypothetical protein
MSSEPGLTNGHSQYGEEEPLLGNAGDASQKEGTSLASNLFLGMIGRPRLPMAD